MVIPMIIGFGDLARRRGARPGAAIAVAAAGYAVLRFGLQSPWAPVLAGLWLAACYTVLRLLTRKKLRAWIRHT